MERHVIELKADRARIVIELQSEGPVQDFLHNTEFLNYRLAGVELSEVKTKDEPDLIWHMNKDAKDLSCEGSRVVLRGEWYEGEVQRLLVSLLARRMLEKELYLFHASAVFYMGKAIMFLGGESNSGKTMSQIEACKRGGEIISTETIVTDRDGEVVMGSKKVFLRVRSRGTERIDKPNQDEGVARFFAETPEFALYEGKCNIDLVILPDIDGNYSTVAGAMSDFEKQYQTFHCLCDYFGLHLLLAPGRPMPILDTEELRLQRAAFIRDFARRPYYFIRGKDPQIIIDEVDRILGTKENCR